MKKRLIAIIMISTITSGCFMNSSININTAYGKEISVEEMDKQLDETLEKIKKLESQNEETQKKINEIHDEVDKIEEENKQLEKDNKKIEKEIEELNKEKEEKYELIRSIIKIEYEQKAGGYLTLLLEAESFSNFLMRVEVVRNLIRNNNFVVDEIKSLEKQLDEKSTKLESQMKRIEEQKKYAESELKRLNTLVEDRTKDKKELLAIQEKLEDEMEKIRQQHSQSSTGEYTGGSMGWPVPGMGTISSYYGNRVHPVTGVLKLHDGIDIPGPVGTPIVAAEDGVVTKASYHTAYGNWIIVDHGGGVLTYYAHNSEMLVSVGQRVKRGQTIAKMGSTGYSTGSHCHFSVVVNGSFTDPLNYLK